MFYPCFMAEREHWTRLLCLQKPTSLKRSESPEKGGDSTTGNEVSFSDKLSAVNKIVVDMCGHCNKTCDADGIKGEAFQCDLCEGWVHASCENISSKHYKSFSSLAKSIH